jgi:hypothetical protein
MNRRFAVPLLLVAPWAFAQDGKDNGVFEPGVQHVCVPAADGEGWDCGTVDAPPENYTPPDAQAESEPVAAMPEAANTEPLPEPESAPEPEPEPEPVPAADLGDAQTPAPPPFLADPMRDTPYAPVEEPSSEPGNAAEAVIAAEQTAPPAEPVVEAPAEPVVTPAPEAAPVADVVPEPEPVTAPATIEPEPVSPAVAIEPAAAVPESAPEPAPLPASTPIDAPIGDAAGFAQLPATAFTLQLAYAANTADFPRLVAALGLDPATCYALRVRGTNGPTWLLAHGAFADANAAKAAQAQLPKVAGLLAQWPRRIGALQTEITQGH